MADNTMEVRVRKKVAKQLYDALNTVDHGRLADGEPDEDPQRKLKPPKPRRESPYGIQNILWLISSIAVFHFTDFARAAIYDHRIKRNWFNIGIVLICINLSIAFFLIVYLSWVRKLDSDDWERCYPAAIPIATACFAFGSFCVMIGMWPVFGALTMPILFTQFMGVVVLIAMLPAFG